MSSPDRSCSPFNDVQENVRQFNEDECVWRCFVKKRARRKWLARLLQSLGVEQPLTENQLELLDWLAAEREARPTRAVGKWISP
jgi:hypothetical protein